MNRDPDVILLAHGYIDVDFPGLGAQFNEKC